MANLRDLSPGVYWKGSTGTWHALTLEDIEANTNSVIENAVRIGISTGYHDDLERLSFSIKIPTTDLVEHEFDDVNTNYGTVFQWHFFLAYKNIINAFTEKRGGYSFRETIWTKTVYNKGNEGENNGIQWGIDLAYESSMVLKKSGTAYGIHILNEDSVVEDMVPVYDYINMLKRPGIYYTATQPSVSSSFLPLLSAYGNAHNISDLQDMWIYVNTRQFGDERGSFYFRVLEYEHLLNPAEDRQKVLSKYQWEYLFGYKDLLDELYREKNKNKTPGTLDMFSLPGMFLTSTKYIGKEKSIAENENKPENSEGVGIYWAVCPSFATSQIVIKEGNQFSHLNYI